MYKIIACLLLLPLGMFAQKYKKIHQKSMVVDTHNDFLTESMEKNISFDEDLRGRTHSDLQRMRAAGVDVQIFSVWCDGSFGKGKAYERANREIDSLYAFTARNPNQMRIVRTPKELERAVKEKKLACMMGVEGGHMIEDKLSNLDELFNRGVRYMTLTWNNSTSWASSAMDESRNTLGNRKKGLNEFGKQVVRRMNELGMIVDVSHVGEQTFWDAIQTTTKPVIASHSCAHALCPVFRNLKDDQIRAIGQNGGVIHLNFFSGFIDSNFQKRNAAFAALHKAERDTLLKMNPEPYFADQYLFEKYPEEVMGLKPPISMLIDHLDHIVQLIGVNHVGMGSDFDGISSTPQQLDDITGYPLITKAMLDRGYSRSDIRKILGENFMRVFKANTPEK